MVLVNKCSAAQNQPGWHSSSFSYIVLPSDNRVLSNCVLMYMCRPRLIETVGVLVARPAFLSLRVLLSVLAYFMNEGSTCTTDLQTSSYSPRHTYSKVHRRKLAFHLKSEFSN